jgi:hypothetical protein
MFRALAEGDHRLEEQSLAELNRLDIDIRIGRSWRRG